MSKRNIGLDLLRCIAILLVLFYHTSKISSNFGIIGFPLKGNGTLGVEIFFVLSGFLIFNILFKSIDKNSDFDFKHVLNFLNRRWLRTIPNYFFVLLITMIGYMFFDTINFDYSFLKCFIFSQYFIPSNFHFFLPSWSLCVEEYCYLATGLLFLLVSFFKSNDKKKLIFFSIISFVVLLKIVNYIFIKYQFTPTTQWNSDIRTITFFRFDSIFIGGILSYIFHVNAKWFHNFKLLKIAIGLILIAIVTFIQQKFLKINCSNFPFTSISIAPLLSIGVALCIPFFYGIEIKNKLIIKVVTQISILSYSLYLINYQMVDVFSHYFDFKTIHLITSLCIYVLLWMLFFAISYLLYNFIELPFMNLREKKFSEK